MRQFIKLITVGLIGLVVLMTATALILPRVIDPNHYRDDISTAVYSNTGLTLSIDEPIGWSIFPWLGLHLERVSIQGLKDSKLMTVDTADIRVKLIPLLSKKIEMQAVNITGVTLNLVKDKTGQGNWEVQSELPVDAPVHETKETTGTQRSTVKEVTSETSSLSSLVIDITSITVDGLNLNYSDLATGEHYVIDHASLTTGAVQNNKPVDFTITAHINSTHPELKLATNLNATLMPDIERGLYQLTNLSMSATPGVENGETVKLAGHMEMQLSPLRAQGQIDVASFNLGHLLKQLNMALPSTADPLGKMAFHTGFTADEHQLSASQLSLTLDDFTMDGTLTVTDLKKQRIVFELKGDDLDLDRYLPPEDTQSPSETETSASASTTTVSAEQVALIPEDALRPLNVQGSVTLNSLKIANMVFEKPSVNLLAEHGVSDIALNSGFYRGHIAVKTTMDLNKQSNPVMTNNTALKAIDLKALSTAIPSLTSIEGSVSADMDLKTHGLYQKQLTQNLNGNIHLTISNGAFTQANFDKLVCEGVALVRKKNLTQTQWDSATRFTQLGGHFTISNGVASNRDLTAALSHLNLTGDGEIYLVTQSIDYYLGLNVRGSDSPDSDPACQINEDYRDITWPVRCHGQIDQPQCDIDQKRLTKTASDIVKKKAIKRLEEKIEEKGGSLKDVLKSLF